VLMVTYLDEDGAPNTAQAELDALIGTTPEEILTSNESPSVAEHAANGAAAVPAPYTSKLEAALDHAARGFAVFPLRTNDKIPRFEGWQAAATSDRAQIQRWWSQWPKANIGILTTSLLVVDIDPRNGGDASAKALHELTPFPKTLCSKTQGGGAHMIYRLPDGLLVSGKNHQLGRGIDIKSDRGLIVAPGSTFEGRPYTWLNSRPIAPAPQWLIEKCSAAQPKSALAAKRVVQEDDWARAAAWKFAQNAPDAQEGTRNDACVALANKMFDVGAELDTAVAYVTEWSTHLCFPPMDPDEIQVTVASAMRSRKNPIGCSHPLAPGFDPVEIAPRSEWSNHAPSAATINESAPSTQTPIQASATPPIDPPRGYKEALTYVIEAAPTQLEEPKLDVAAASVASELLAFDITEAQILDLMQDWACSSYEQELDSRALSTALELAKGTRASIPASDSDVQSSVPDVDIAIAPDLAAADAAATTSRNEEKGKPRASLFPPLIPYAPETTPQRPWIVPGFACRGNVTMLAGPGGVAKSTWTLQVAIAAITGREDICGFKVPSPQRVAVWNQEDDDDELRRRLSAIMQAFNVSWNDLKDERGVVRLSLRSGVEAPLVLAKRTLEGTICPTPQLRAMIESVKTQGIDLLVLDPLVELHEAGENDNVQMRCVIGYVRNIAKEGNCAVLLVAHSKKPDKARSDSFAGDMDSARGASAQVAAIRIGATIYNGGKKDATEWAFDGSHLDHVRIDIAKNNLGPKSKEARWFKYDGVRVGGFEGESVGVLRPVALKRKGAAPAAVAAANEMLCHVADVISHHLPPSAWHALSNILPHMRTEIAAPLRDQKNRARTIKEAFDGADEYATDFGVLRRKAGPGTKGTLFFLAPPQPPQNSV
jgi:hypothetical protein